MAVSGRRVTVTDEPTRLDSGSDSRDKIAGQTVTVLNTDAALTVDLGDSDVAEAEGFPLAPGAGILIPLNVGDELFGVAPAGETIEVSILESGV